jgi:hypothetical protein
VRIVLIALGDSNVARKKKKEETLTSATLFLPLTKAWEGEKKRDRTLFYLMNRNVWV